MLKEISPFFLYSHITSSSSFRVRAAAKLMGIFLNIQPVNLLALEHKTEWYKKINPFGTVPALVVAPG